MKRVFLLAAAGCFGVTVMCYFDMRAAARAGDTAMTIAEGFPFLANLIAGLFLLQRSGESS